MLEIAGYPGVYEILSSGTTGYYPALPGNNELPRMEEGITPRHVTLRKFPLMFTGVREVPVLLEHFMRTYPICSRLVINIRVA
eukprot:90053-Amorphochlora_amoeboformis.AAC.1